MTHFCHVVLFRLHDGADVEEVVSTLKAARPVSGAVSWQVEQSLDARKGAVIAQLSTFESAEAFRTWRDSDAHQTAADHLRQVADWLVADWEAS